jgi:hypothetical protein
MRERFPARDEPPTEDSTDVFGDQALGLAAVHVELVRRGLSQFGHNSYPVYR